MNPAPSEKDLSTLLCVLFYTTRRGVSVIDGYKEVFEKVPLEEKGKQFVRIASQMPWLRTQIHFASLVSFKI